MNYSDLALHIFRKPLEECSEEEVRQTAGQYPYFAPLQFLFVQKLKADANQSPSETAKAPLYHHNVLALDPILYPDKYRSEQVFTQRQEEIIVPETAPASEEKVPDAETVSEVATEEPELPVVSLPKMDISAPPVGDLSFEPYHMVDYFASQGIKLSREEETKDQFGKQLKSFTEWLKTMKRLPVSQMVAQMDSHSENRVKNMAEHSVDQSEIVTESMAEVWLKQGNKEKAIELYNKLSLLNPSKKHYFAGLIEKLK